MFVNKNVKYFELMAAVFWQVKTYLPENFTFKPRHLNTIISNSCFQEHRSLNPMKGRFQSFSYGLSLTSLSRICFFFIGALQLRVRCSRLNWMLLKRGMGNGKWGMGNGEWGMGNGEWEIENGKSENGKLKMKN